MKTALVISGGGSKGAFAVGAIEELRKKNVKFDIVAGTSTGALIAPLVAIDDIDEMIAQYTTIHTPDIIRKNWRGLFWKGIYHFGPLEKRMRKTLFEGDPSRYSQLMKSDVKLLLCTVSLQTGKVLYYSQKADQYGTLAWKDQDGLIQSILGSASQPFLTPPVEWDGQQLVDGGVREIAPLNVAIRNGAERIYVILNSHPEKFDEISKPCPNIIKIGMRTLELMLDEIVLNDVHSAIQYNRALAHIEKMKARARECLSEIHIKHIFSTQDSLFEGKRQLDIKIIRPNQPLILNSLEFDPTEMQHMREMGQKAVKDM